MEKKLDMHTKCGCSYEEMWVLRKNGKITEEEFQHWYSSNCAKCWYMSEICMFGEE